jgi:hypothetical protein
VNALGTKSDLSEVKELSWSASPPSDPINVITSNDTDNIASIGYSSDQYYKYPINNVFYSVSDKNNNKIIDTTKRTWRPDATEAIITLTGPTGTNFIPGNQYIFKSYVTDSYGSNSQEVSTNFTHKPLTMFNDTNALSSFGEGAFIYSIYNTCKDSSNREMPIASKRDNPTRDISICANDCINNPNCTAFTLGDIQNEENIKKCLFYTATGPKNCFVKLAKAKVPPPPQIDITSTNSIILKYNPSEYSISEIKYKIISDKDNKTILNTTSVPWTSTMTKYTIPIDNVSMISGYLYIVKAFAVDSSGIQSTESSAFYSYISLSTSSTGTNYSTNAPKRPGIVFSGENASIKITYSTSNFNLTPIESITYKLFRTSDNTTLVPYTKVPWNSSMTEYVVPTSNISFKGENYSFVFYATSSSGVNSSFGIASFDYTSTDTTTIESDGTKTISPKTNTSSTGSNSSNTTTTDITKILNTGTRIVDTSTGPSKVPGNVRDITLEPSVNSVKISFSPPYNNGGSPISYYSIKSVPEDGSNMGFSSPITVGNLKSGKEYKFIIGVTNAANGYSEITTESVTLKKDPKDTTDNKENTLTTIKFGFGIAIVVISFLTFLYKKAKETSMSIQSMKMQQSYSQPNSQSYSQPYYDQSYSQSYSQPYYDQSYYSQSYSQPYYDQSYYSQPYYYQ